MWQKRVIFTILLLFSMLFLPFWISAILALIGIFYFDFYLEAFVIFLLADLLYSTTQTRFLELSFINALVVSLVIILGEFVKRNSKFYSNRAND